MHDTTGCLVGIYAKVAKPIKRNAGLVFGIHRVIADIGDWIH